MQLNNPFPQETRLLFLYVYACFKCGRSNRGLELHHITGRDSSSAFNACPLCHDCHVAILHTQEVEKELFNYVMEFLIRERYQPTEDDYTFLRNHPYLIV